MMNNYPANIRTFITLLCILLITACSDKKQQELTPWGTALEESDSIPTSEALALSDIQSNGEMIVLTMSGPQTYFDYHGKGLGMHYMLAEKFAQRIGVSLRVEVCKDTTEMVRRLEKGEGDIIAFPLPRSMKGVRFAGLKDSNGNGWAVNNASRELADSLNRWFRPAMIEKTIKEEDFLLSTRSVVRHVYSPYLDRSGGVISHYDHLFQKYAPLARWDWRLIAAQCYQESAFDPHARSWAGARGLMQVMPATAAMLGLPEEQMEDPEANIAAAARYISMLSGKFRDVPASERIFFVLASYNGGYNHVRDAMALASKYGKSPHRWADVEQYILGLREPRYYNDPVVRYGYMRGNETADYVARIRSRWAEYRGGARPGFSNPSGFKGAPVMTPERAGKKYKWHL